jgi:hypothetical protein
MEIDSLVDDYIVLNTRVAPTVLTDGVVTGRATNHDDTHHTRQNIGWTIFMYHLGFSAHGPPCR